MDSATVCTGHPDVEMALHVSNAPVGFGAPAAICFQAAALGRRVAASLLGPPSKQVVLPIGTDLHVVPDTMSDPVTIPSPRPGL
jgi:hypothetical protein